MSYPNLYYAPNNLPNSKTRLEGLNNRFKNTQFNLNPPPSTPSEASGFDLGGAIGAGTTGLSLVGSAVGMANTDLGISTQAPDQQYSATGQPVYDGSYYNEVTQVRPQGAGALEVGSAVAQGASAGAAFGGIGAGIGAGVGLITSLIGGRRRRKRQEEQKRRASTSAIASQQAFNLADQQFDENQIVMQDYQNRLNRQYRLNNLY